MSVQLWLTSRAIPLVRKAEEFERMGWDGIAYTDSQNWAGDPYVALTAAALTTSRIQLAVGVTNPPTRHAAVTACAAASIQVESGGRMSLGIGRGDSALAHLGLRPASVEALRRYVQLVQAYLRGDAVTMAEARGDATNLIDHRLPLADAPRASQLRWLRNGPPVPKVPVFVAASGPRTIRVAAEHADRVMLAVGADPERVRWGIQLARAVRPDVKIGLFVNLVVHEDREAALRMAGGRIAAFARFSAMHGTVTGPASQAQRAVFAGLAADYQMTRHGHDGTQNRRLTPGFAERFAVLGPAPYCLDRLVELAGLGVDRFHIIGPKPEFERDARQRFADQLMGPLRDKT
jgi:5,10-methylenetetrahydromethanopterin reductase